VPGACRLTYAATRAGKVLAEFTVTREGEVGGESDHDFYLVGPRDYAQHDLAWLEGLRASMAAEAAEAGVPFDASTLELADISTDVEILHVAGPTSLPFLQAVCPAVAEIGFLKMKPIEVCGAPARVFCISFSGELGYELHVPAEHAAALYEAIWSHPAAKEHGLQPFGGHAVNSLRIEKGFKVKADLDFAHWTEAGIEPFVKLKRKATHQFLGRDAAPPEGGAARRAAMFEVEAPTEYAWSVPGDSPVRDAAGSLVGFTTTSALGAVTGRTIALGYVKMNEAGQPLAAPTDAGLYVECYGHQMPLRVLPEQPVGLGHATSGIQVQVAQPASAAAAP